MNRTVDVCPEEEHIVRRMFNVVGVVLILLLLVHPFVRPIMAQQLLPVASTPDSSAVIPDVKAATTIHVRVADPRLRQILARAADSSPTLQNLLARLEDSDVVAYVECDLRLQSRMAGHLTFISAAGGLRYVLIRVAHVGAPSKQAALIGHELRHAVEVAALTAIVDEASFEREYTRIGFPSPVPSGNGVKVYETRNARLAGENILRELQGDTD